VVRVASSRIDQMISLPPGPGCCFKKVATIRGKRPSWPASPVNSHRRLLPSGFGGGLVVPRRCTPRSGGPSGQQAATQPGLRTNSLPRVISVPIGNASNSPSMAW
jgi:hypothetical protein